MVRLETDRLILRSQLPEDFEGLWKIMADEPPMDYTGGVALPEYDDRFEAFKRSCAVPPSDEGVELTVIDKATGGYMGYIGFYSGDDRKELYYGYRKELWGKGYGTEAADMALRYFFFAFANEEYSAEVDSENSRSANVLQKLGFVRTDAYMETYGYTDIYTITREAWNERHCGRK